MAKSDWDRRKGISRREVIVGSAVASGIFISSSGIAEAETTVLEDQSETEESLSDTEVVEVLKEEGEPGFVPRATIKNFWFQEPEGQRPSAHWPTDNVSFDYLPLGKLVAAGSKFNLKADTLQKLAERNAFDLGEDTKVLFGLRGCTVVSGKNYSPAANTHAVITTRPDHLNLQCVIGVWNRSNDTISLCRGSTVPNVDLMQAYIRGQVGCNMLLTGLHHYKVSPHRGNKQPGAFRQQQSLWILRSRNKLGYAANDRDVIWDDMDGE